MASADGENSRHFGNLKIVTMICYDGLEYSHISISASLINDDHDENLFSSEAEKIWSTAVAHGGIFNVHKYELNAQ